jgi:hypothetical protein
MEEQDVIQERGEQEDEQLALEIVSDEALSNVVGGITINMAD